MSTASRVLVLEDETLIAMMLRDWLIELGCEPVGPASTVADALDFLREATIDGAILDLTLSGESCYPVADELSKRAIPFALTTGHSASDVAAPYRHAPILLKPFDFDAVRKVLSALLASSPD